MQHSKCCHLKLFFLLYLPIPHFYTTDHIFTVLRCVLIGISSKLIHMTLWLTFLSLLFQSTIIYQAATILDIHMQYMSLWLHTYSVACLLSFWFHCLSEMPLTELHIKNKTGWLSGVTIGWWKFIHCCYCHSTELGRSSQYPCKQLASADTRVFHTMQIKVSLQLNK